MSCHCGDSMYYDCEDLRSMVETLKKELDVSNQLARAWKDTYKNHWPSPCVICGYNGPGFHQPETHSCAEWATERDALLAELERTNKIIDRLREDLSAAIKASGKLELQNVVKQICYEFTSTVAHAERPKGGMQVPFHGDFASAAQLPSVVSRMRWWVGRFTEALKASEEKPHE
jgi:hypothetical protein